jgi:hypothetical protein
MERLRVKIRAQDESEQSEWLMNVSNPTENGDPIAELARLIGQADRHRRSVPAERHFRKETTSRGHDASPELPPAPQLPGHWMLMSKSTGLMSTAVARKSMTPTIDTASPAKITKIIRMKFRASAAAG